MHWILQKGPFGEPAMQEMARVLKDAGIPYSEHTAVPFAGRLDPDIDPVGKVIVFGSFAMRHVAKRKGWEPGCFPVGKFSFRDCLSHWATHMLNSDAVFGAFGDARPTINPFFIRPSANSKHFPGTVMSLGDLARWQKQVEFGSCPYDGSTLRGSTEVLWCAPKAIEQEYRLWIVRGSVATASLYRSEGRVVHSSVVDRAAIRFGEEMAALWTPAEAFVLDVCLYQGGWKIVEINLMNTAALFAANVRDLVGALEQAFG